MQSDDVSRNSGVDRVNELTVCPSFSTYYSDRQAAAARAVNDVLASSSNQSRSELDEDEFGFAVGRFEKSDCAVDEDDDFEFSILCNGNEIGQIFPIFDRDLVGEATALKVDAASVSLKKLFLDEERDDRESESEAEDELESVEPGTYCVWRPTKTPPSPSPFPSLSPSLSPSRCNKSKSTGSCSKRWKLRDLLLRRSNSDGKDSFVYLTPSPTTSSSSSSSNSNLNSDELKAVKSRTRRASAHEMFYVEKRAGKEEDKKRSYLPYRKGLVGFGFFPTGMSVTNNFRPF